LPLGGLFTNDLSGNYDGATAIAIDAGGRIVLGGTTSVGNSESFAMRLLDDGSLDTSFNGIGSNIISAGVPHEDVADLAIQADGKIVLAGSAYTSSGINDISVIRLNDNGTLDITFDGDGMVRLPVGTATDDVSSVVIDRDGNIVVTGRTDATTNGFHLTRFVPDGLPDPRFDPVNTLDNNPSFIEGGSAVVLDGDVEIFDEELTTIDSFNGATLTLARNGGANIDG